MTLKDIFQKSRSSNFPVEGHLIEDQGMEVLAVGLAPGVELPEHVYQMPARLVAIEGKVSVSSDSATFFLNAFEQYDVSAGENLRLRAMVHSLILVIKISV